MKDLTGVPDEEKHKHLNWHSTKVVVPAALEAPNVDDLMRRIFDEFARSNIFVERLVGCKRHHEWSDMQFLAQAVVILAEQNNRLQDELQQMHYAKAFPNPIDLTEDAALQVLTSAVSTLKGLRSER